MNKSYTLKGQLAILKEGGIILTLVLAVTLGTWYTFYVEGKNTQTFEVLYTWLTRDYVRVNVISFSYIVMKNLKKFLFIWLLGWMSLTIPLSWVLLFSMIFSYSFTTTSLILIFGSKGMAIGMFAYGLQAIFAVSIGMEILKRSIDLMGNDRGQAKKQYLKILIPILVASGIMALLDLGVMNNLKIFL